MNLYRQAMEGLQSSNDPTAEANVLGNLGSAYRELEDYQSALDCLNRGLQIAEQCQDRGAECQALLNLANVYSDLGADEKAIDCYQRCLAEAREIQDYLTESEALCDFAATLVYLNQIPDAMQYYEASLKICQRIGNAYTAAFIYKNLAEIATTSGLSDAANDFRNEALKLAQELDLPFAENW